jgi:hypothetical protein
MHDNGSLLLNEIRKRRWSAIEIIVVIIFLGLLLSVTGCILYDLIKDKTVMKFSIVILLGSLTLLTLALILKREISEHIEFRLLLPLRSDPKGKHFEKIKGYAPSEYAERVYTPIIEKNSLGAKLGNEAKGCLQKKTDCNPEIILNLVRALIYDVIKEFGDRSLTTSSLYHEKFRHLSWRLESEKIEKEALHQVLKANEFIRGGIRVPNGVFLEYKSKTNAAGNESIGLLSKYSSLKIEILPYWSLLTAERKKTFNIVMRNINNSEHLMLLLIPLRCSLRVTQAKVFCRRTEVFFYWMYDLMLELNRWLSWDEYIQGDTERIVVDIYRRIKILDIGDTEKLSLDE